MLSNTHLAMILDTLARRLYEQADPYDDVVADVAEALDALFWLLSLIHI